MGVPKFFRYISERYPCLSEIVKEYQIPDFDNLYLDMNGIIHNCSHPDDDDPHFRISEEKIFQDIFHYIEILFRMIKPRKLFFMAIDGVAPRAKMNQQRARRFRSAKDAEKMEEKALKKGEVLPSDERFDSNCITPGTEFMANLHEQLKYFIVNKISTDKLWRECRVILSGHETPGEGEHKIMDYIRYMKAQPQYDPNTRHCLYGLDADLIMLGLCTHEPHFSLLREEVKFGKKANKRRSAPEDIKFYLLHLSLMREYLGLEFKQLETDNRLKFKYDIEKIIDDWVLMGFLVGNDFIPHLPNLHIAQGALPHLYKTYMKVLPTFDGYLNEEGRLNLIRFEKFMECLAEIDVESFQEQYADLKYFEAKTGRRPNEQTRKSNKLEPWTDNDGDLIDLESLEPTKPMSSDLAALIKNTDDMFLEPNDLGEENLDIEGDLTEYDSDASESEMFHMEFKQHKRDYYTNKLEYASVTPEVLRSQAEGYVKAIQWNLNYYYNGCCSWSWYYPHHYAPYISDIKGFADLKISFDFGRPFKSYEQLLAVLPPASKKLLPVPYHKLMLDEDSIIKSFYPEDFATDLNGKKAEWEAVVLIPFIDEKLLLQAMEPCNAVLSLDEIKRNTHGPMLIYQHTKVAQEPYEAPQYFPPVEQNFAICSHLTIDDIRVPEDKLIKGAYPGAKYDVFFPGFPTTKHLKYTHRVENIKVRVHEQPSRNESMVLTINFEENTNTLDAIARELLGRTVYVGWPHLVEALVVTISDKRFRYHHSGEQGQYNTVENKGNVEKDWQLERTTISDYYKNRFGIEVGEVSVLVHVRVMIGRRYMFMPNGRVTLEKEWSPTSSPYPLQAIVKDILVHDEKYSSYRDIENVFPVGSSCWMLGHPCYGCLAEIKDSKDTLKNGRLKVLVKSCEEPNLESVRAFEREMRTKYMNLNEASSRLALSRVLFSRITGAILVSASTRFHTTDDTNKINIGLNLKFSKRNEEVPGYTRKEGTTWLYTDKAVEIVQDFQEFCPELFQYLNTHNESMYYLEDIFPNGNGKEMLGTITQWIKKQPFYSLERRSCGSMLMDPDVVKELENTIEDYKKTVKESQISMQVKPHILYKPDLFMGNVPPDNGTKFQLYDRVVNVRESYTVPLGLRGTIIAIHKSSTGKDSDMVYDILFDEPFPGGLALNCSPNRGYRLPNAALINKSHGQRVYEQKCGVAKTAQKATQSADQMPYFYPQYGSPKAPYTQSTPFKQQRDTQPPNEIRYVMTNPNRGSSRQPAARNRNESVGNIPPQVIDPPSDLLKQILKIDDGMGTPMQCDKGTTEAKKITVEDIFKLHQNPQSIQQSPQVRHLAPATEGPARTPKFNSVQLLEYFQSNCLGLPHYSYFNVAKNQIQAQLLHPLTGNVVIGAPCANKQDACENVAGVALNLIAKGGIATTPLPPQIPQPPKNWTAPNRSPEKSNKQKPAPVKPHVNSTQKPPAQHTLQNAGASGNVSGSASAFVPLQAVRKHITKNTTPNSKDNPPKENGGNSAKSDKVDRRVNQNAQNSSQKSTGQSASSQKPMRRRRMRLAANFDTKPTI